MSATSVVCSAARMQSGLGLRVAVAASATAGKAALVRDEGSRTIRPTGSLTIARAPGLVGGYSSVQVAGPGHPFHPGKGDTVTLRVTVLPGVLDPGSVTFDSGITEELTVMPPLPAGCRKDPILTVVICTPTGAGTSEFILTVSVKSAKTHDQTLAHATVPGGTIQMVSDPSRPLIVEPSIRFSTLTVAPSGLVAGQQGVLIVTGSRGSGVLDPGKITLPNDLGHGVGIIGVISGDCSVSSGTTVCTPTEAKVSIWKLKVQVAPTAQQGDRLALPRITGTDGDYAVGKGPGTDLLIRGAPTTCQRPAMQSNGDFERPVVAPGAGAMVPESSGDGWHTPAGNDVIGYWHNDGNVVEANAGVPIAAESGDQWVELNANQQSSLYQDVATTPGQVVHWSIAHQSRNVAGFEGGKDVMQVEVGVPGQSLTAVEPDVATDPTNVTWISDGPAWRSHTGTYLVPAGQTITRFQFSAVSSSSGRPTFGNFLDDISFTTAPCLTATTTVTKLIGKGSATHAGEHLRYTTTIHNAGGATASNLIIAPEAIPTNTTLVGPPPVGFGTLAAGATITVTFVVKVDSKVPVGTMISGNTPLTYAWGSGAAGAPLQSRSAAVVRTVS